MLYLTEPESLGDVLAGEPPYRVEQLRSWLYDTPVLDVEGMTNLPLPLRRRLSEDLYPFRVEIAQSADGGRTRKWLLRSTSGASIEAVLMGYPGRITLCISSQAGCAVGCTACATGQCGFERHLEAGEIVGQAAYARAFFRREGLRGSPRRLTNVVFMGMGEPLANFDRVRESLGRMIEVMGLDARSITVSTVGFVPGMRRLAETPWQVSLAVSLHAADDDLRSRLVPLNERYPLAAVIAAARHYADRKRRRVSIEWTLIAGTNDGPDQGAKLARIAKDLRAHVNVIALNPTPLTDDRAPSADRVARFVELLRERGVSNTVRDTRAVIDVPAASSASERRAQPVSLTPSRIDRSRHVKLQQGDVAPFFSRLDHAGADVTLDDYAGNPLVIYFYPKAFTPGCTTESCDFRDRHEAFSAAGYEIVGVSPDPVSLLAGFKEEHRLPFPLLSDEDHAMAEAYGAWGLKKNYGKEYQGIIRSTIVVGGDGRVEHAWYNVKASGHAERVAQELAPG